MRGGAFPLGMVAVPVAGLGRVRGACRDAGDDVFADGVRGDGGGGVGVVVDGAAEL